MISRTINEKTPLEIIFSSVHLCVCKESLVVLKTWIPRRLDRVPRKFAEKLVLGDVTDPITESAGHIHSMGMLGSKRGGDELRPTSPNMRTIVYEGGLRTSNNINESPAKPKYVSFTSTHPLSQSPPLPHSLYNFLSPCPSSISNMSHPPPPLQQSSIHHHQPSALLRLF